MGQSNAELRDALKKLSAAKYGTPRAESERAIFARLGAGDTARKEKMDALKKAQEDRMATLQRGGTSGVPGSSPQSGAPRPTDATPGSGGSFLDEWLAKRQQIATTPTAHQPEQNPAFGPTAGAPLPVPMPVTAAHLPEQQATPLQNKPNPFIEQPKPAEQPQEPVMPVAPIKPPEPPAEPVEVNKLHVREPGQNADDEVHVKLR
jgi:hypothetical protein